MTEKIAYRVDYAPVPARRDIIARRISPDDRDKRGDLNRIAGLSRILSPGNFFPGRMISATGTQREGTRKGRGDAKKFSWSFFNRSVRVLNSRIGNSSNFDYRRGSGFAESRSPFYHAATMPMTAGVGDGRGNETGGCQREEPNRTAPCRRRSLLSVSVSSAPRRSCRLK